LSHVQSGSKAEGKLGRRNSGHPLTVTRLARAAEGTSPHTVLIKPFLDEEALRTACLGTPRAQNGGRRERRASENGGCATRGLSAHWCKGRINQDVDLRGGPGRIQKKRQSRDCQLESAPGSGRGMSNGCDLARRGSRKKRRFQ